MDATKAPEPPPEPEHQLRRMLNVGQVLAIVPVSRTTLWRLESQKKFPPGHMVLGTKLWFADEIAAWQDGLPAAKLSRRSRSGA